MHRRANHPAMFLVTFLVAFIAAILSGLRSFAVRFATPPVFFLPTIFFATVTRLALNHQVPLSPLMCAVVTLGFLLLTVWAVCLDRTTAD